VKSRSEGTLHFLPLGLDVRRRSCVVVGGGSVGTRKVENLVTAGAKVTVVAPSVTGELAEHVESGTVTWINDSFESRQLDGAFLVVAATDDTALNEEIVRLAVERGTLVCDASAVDRSQFIFGALIRNADTTVAVFTDGRDPAHARRTRDRIADMLDRESDSGLGSGEHH